MFCPKCGAANDDTSKFCLTCGGPLSQGAAAPPAAPPPAQTYYQAPPPAAPAKKSHTGIIVIIVLLLVLGIGAAAVFFVMSKKDDKDDKTTAAQTTVSASTTKQSDNNNTTSADNEGQPDASDVQNILNGLGYNDWDGNWNNLTAEQKAAIESYYSALGENVQFTPDGLVMVDENGNVITWGGKWPNSPLLNDVPKPGFGSVFSSSVEGDEVTIVYSGWNAEQFVDYIGLVKAAGFDKDVSEATIMGFSTYSANNGNVVISVAQSMGFYAITVEKMP